MDVSYKSIKGIINRFITDTGERADATIREGDLLSFANRAAKMCYSTDLYDEKVVLLPVIAGRVELPDDYQVVIQTAFTPKLPDKCKETVCNKVSEYSNSSCNVKYEIKCSKCGTDGPCVCKRPIVTVDADRLWRGSYPEYEMAYLKHFYGCFKIGYYDRSCGSAYHPEFILLRRKQDNYHYYKDHIKECLNFRVNTSLEYDIKRPHLILNRQVKGYILLSYLGSKTDDDGYLMIPDNEYMIDYIIAFIENKLAYARWRASRDNKDYNFYQVTQINENKALQLFHQKKIPEYDKFAQFLRNKMNKVMPYDEIDVFANMGRFKKDEYMWPMQTYGEVNLDWKL